MRILAKDGHKRLTLDVNSGICNDEGKPLGIHSIARDMLSGRGGSQANAARS
jgi:hypothetical protein